MFPQFMQSSSRGGMCVTSTASLWCRGAPHWLTILDYKVTGILTRQGKSSPVKGNPNWWAQIDSRISCCRKFDEERRLLNSSCPTSKQPGEWRRQNSQKSKGGKVPGWKRNKPPLLPSLFSDRLLRPALGCNQDRQKSNWFVKVIGYGRGQDTHFLGILYLSIRPFYLSVGRRCTHSHICLAQRHSNKIPHHPPVVNLGQNFGK